MGRIASILLLALGATLCLTGCFTLDSAEIPMTHEQHVVVSNYGWYLFHFIPLACGNASDDALTPWVLFRNDVAMEKIQKRYMDYAERSGRRTGQHSYHTIETVLFEIPGTAIPLPIPYLLTYREVQLSGVME